MKSPWYSMSPNLNGMEVSPTLWINEKSKELQEAGRTVYKFGLGESPFPVPDVVVEALKANADRKSYLPVSGLSDLQRSIAAYLQRTRGLTYAPERIFVGPGSKELIYSVQLCYGADLLLPSPSWVSYAPQARIANQAVHWLDTSADQQWKLRPDVLAEHCRQEPDRPRILILNYPNNPHGYTYSAEELKELAEVAAEYQVLVLSDEIYGGLHHAGAHHTMATYYPAGTIISDGLSKWCGAGGWRLGFFAFPENLAPLKEAMTIVASETFTSVSAPIQYAAIRAFEGGEEVDRYLFLSRKIMHALGGYIAQKLRVLGCDLKDPEGAFYLFPDFSAFAERFQRRGLRTSKMLCERILDETGVAMLPGSSFGRPDDEYTVRLSYVDFDGAAALQAAGQIDDSEPLDAAFLEQHSTKCIDGIDRLCDWVRAQ